MPSPRCRVCTLPEPLQEEVVRRLRGLDAAGASVPPLSGPKVSAWLLAEHQVEVKYPAINEHMRRHLPQPAEADVATPPPPPRPPRPRKAADKTPPATMGETSSPAPTAPATPQGVGGPPPNPVLEFIDTLCTNTAALVMDLNDAVRKRIGELPATVTDSPGLPDSGTGAFPKRLPPPGPTDAEARYLTGGLAGINALLKTRTLYVGAGAGSAGRPAELEAMVGGLKASFTALGLPSPPPAIDGDAPDPTDDSLIPGYEAANPEPLPRPDDEEPGIRLAPDPPASGPRQPGAPVAAASPPPPLRAVAGGAWSGWKPPPPTPQE